MGKYGWACMLILLGLFACDTPNGYVIQAKLTGFPDSTLFYLDDRQSQLTVDSARLIGGQLRMEGFLPEEPRRMRFGAILKSSIVFLDMMIGNEKITISGDLSDFPYYVSVSGSKYHDQYVDFEKGILTYRLQQDSVLKICRAMSAEERTTPQGIRTMEALNEFNVRMDSVQTDYLFRYPDTYPSLVYLGQKMFDISKDTVKMLFGQMSEDLQSSSFAKPVQTYIDSPSIAVGDPFMDFEAEDQNGNRVRLSDFVGKEGKYLLLDFTHRWCKPCMVAAKEMRQMVDTYSDSLRIVSFSMDAKRDDWTAAFRRDSVCWTTLWSDEQLNTQAVSIPYQVRSYPTFFVIDPQGCVIQKWIGFGPGFFEKHIGWLKNK